MSYHAGDGPGIIFLADAVIPATKINIKHFLAPSNASLLQ